MTHGTQTCPACGGYLQPLKDLAGQFWSKCRTCNTESSIEKKNTDRDFLRATVYDYDENP